MREIKIFCTASGTLDISEMEPFQGKFKSLSKQNYQRLRNTLLNEGIAAAITIWKHRAKNFMLDGHQRREALTRMRAEGIEIPPIPVNFTECENETDARRKVLALASTYGEVSAEYLQEFSKLAAMDLSDLKDSFNFPDLDLDGLIRSVGASAMSTGRQDDSFVAKPKNSITKIGDIWKLEGHRLLCGDSTKESEVKKVMNGKKALVMNTDPPYGINHVANSKTKGQSQGFENITGDELDGKELQKFLEDTIRAAVPHLVDNAAFYLWHPMLTQGTFFAAAAAADILIHRQIIWAKPSLVFGRGDYHWQHELCFYGWRTGQRPPFLGPRNQTTLWQAGRENDKVHPTQKPVKLFEIPIMNHTKKGEIIYEPFAGSGSQFIAAERTERLCFGIELDPGYCDVVVNRWEQETGKKAERIKK
jgi:DNA modification methylase